MINRLAVILRSVQKGGIENHVYDLFCEAIERGYVPVLIILTSMAIDKKFIELPIRIISLGDQWSSSVKSNLLIALFFIQGA